MFSRKCPELMVPTITEDTPAGSEKKAKVLRYRATPVRIVVTHGVTAGEAFLDQNTLSRLVCLGDNRRLAGVRTVIGQHEHIHELDGAQAAFDGLGTHADGAQQAFGPKLLQGLQTARSFENVEILAIGVDQYEVEIVRAQIAQALFDAFAHVARGKIKMRAAAGEHFTYLGAKQPLIAVGQQPAEAFLTAAIGRRGVEQVDAGFPRRLQQGCDFPVGRQFEVRGIFDFLIAAEFYRAKSETGYLHAGCAEFAPGKHDFSSRKGCASGGGPGRPARAGFLPGTTPSLPRRCSTMSASTGARVSFVGQATTTSSSLVTRHFRPPALCDRRFRTIDIKATP